MKIFSFFSVGSGCVSVSAFNSLDGVPVGIPSFAVGIRKYKSIIKQKEIKIS